MNRRVAVIAISLILLSLLTVRAENTAPSIPDDMFWRMIAGFSEEGGTFRYENLLSNETSYQTVIPTLKQTRDALQQPGAYIGVGPEQNFTYIAALEPKVAFIVDIRRQNMLEQLMYKALFETSRNRVDFISRLFSRRPGTLNDDLPLDQLFKSFSSEDCDRQMLSRTMQVIEDRLMNEHAFPLKTADLAGMQHVLETFCAAGPQIDYGFVNAPSNLTAPSYAELMTATDGKGQNWSYLATSANFERIRKLQMNNRIVPLVGNFAGKKALHAVAQFLKMKDIIVTVFYVSNVEQYLNPSQADLFRLNVAALPILSTSMFIRFVPPESTVLEPISGFLKNHPSLFHLLDSGISEHSPSSAH